MSTNPVPPDLQDLVQIPKILGARPVLGEAIVGRTPAGQPISWGFGETGWTLAVFLSTSCDGCRDLWEALADTRRSPVPNDLRTLVVTKGAQSESAAEVAALSGEATVVMSDQAWADYGVYSGPFFVLVEGTTAQIATEGVAWSMEQILGAVASARGAR